MEKKFGPFIIGREHEDAIIDDNESKEEASKRRKIRIGLGVLAALGLNIGCWFFLGRNAQKEEVPHTYLYGQTNNPDEVGFKRGFKNEIVENGTPVIQEICQGTVNTFIVRNDKKTKLIKIPESELDSLAIEFYQTGEVRAYGEEDIEFEPEDGRNPEFILAEGTEVEIFPESSQDREKRVRLVKTGQIGYVDEDFVKTDGNIEFSPSDGSKIYLLSFTDWMYLLSTAYDYIGDKKNVIGHVGEPNKNNCIIVSLDTEHPGFCRYLGLKNNLYMSFNEKGDVRKVTGLKELTNSGIQSREKTDIIVPDKEKEKIKDGYFILGVVKKHTMVGKKNKIEKGSLFFKFANGNCVVVTQNGLVNISEQDEAKLEVSFVQEGTAYGDKQSVETIKPFEGHEGIVIEDLARVYTLPLQDDIDMFHEAVYDQDTGNSELIKKENIQDLRNCQIKSGLYIVEAKEKTEIRASEQDQKSYKDNVVETLNKGQLCLVRGYEDGYYFVDDLTRPKTEGGRIQADKVEIKYKITQSEIEEENKKDQKKVSSNKDFREQIAEYNGMKSIVERQQQGTEHIRANYDIFIGKTSEGTQDYDKS